MTEAAAVVPGNTEPPNGVPSVVKLKRGRKRKVPSLPKSSDIPGDKGSEETPEGPIAKRLRMRRETDEGMPVDESSPRTRRSSRLSRTDTEVNRDATTPEVEEKVGSWSINAQPHNLSA